jgi:Na+/H+-dicarboxylate symporter
MKKPALHWQVIIGLLIGVVYAWLSITYGWNQFTIDYIKPIGDIFINLLKLIAVPLVLFSIISGVASLGDIKKLGRMGVKTLFTYVLTTMFAVCVGLVLVNIFKPGEQVSDELLKSNRIRYELWRNADAEIPVLDNINFVSDPANAALVEQIRLEESGKATNADLQDKLDKAAKTKADGPLQPLVDVVPSNIFQSLTAMSMLQIIFFAIFFGIMLVSIKPVHAEPVKKLIDGLNEVFVHMVWSVMKAMPIFVFALMAGQIVKAAGTDPDKFQELLEFLLHYSFVVLLGLAFMVFIFYPTLVKILVKKLGFGRFLNGMRDAQITAFSTSSSVATLPVTINCVHENLGVSERTSSFVLPIGATVNMDGTSLYQAVAVVALAQFHLVDLTLGQQAVIVLTATLASIGAAAVPSAGLVLMIIVLESVGLNPAWIALIFPVDRILDMCRTVVNVTGDGAVSTIIAQSEGELNIPDLQAKKAS